jgi:hypothetical protein
MARAAAAAGQPGGFMALDPGTQVTGAQAMELALADAYLRAGFGDVQLLAAMQAQQVADEVRGVTVDELTIFL